MLFALCGCATTAEQVIINTSRKTILYHSDKTKEVWDDVPARCIYTDTLVEVSIAGGQWLPYHCDALASVKGKWVVLRTKDEDGNRVDYVYHASDVDFGRRYKDVTPRQAYKWDEAQGRYIEK